MSQQDRRAELRLIEEAWEASRRTHEQNQRRETCVRWIDHHAHLAGVFHDHAARHEREQEKYEALLAQQRATRQQRKEQLEKKIFSPTSQNRASYRQALQQAGQAEHERELRNLYDQAVVTNDTDLQQAAVYHAAQRGWHLVVNDYGQRNPQAAQALAEYASPEVNPSDRDLFRERLFRERPQKPEEIRRNSYDA
jgi:hypothetical protein